LGDVWNLVQGHVRSAEEVEKLLQDISPALTVPLQLLREQYHKLGYKD
jgi:hypothetical protein